jgi:hypothetical protein
MSYLLVHVMIIFVKFNRKVTTRVQQLSFIGTVSRGTRTLEAIIDI